MFNKRFWSRLAEEFANKDQHKAMVVSRRHHRISRKNVSDNALKVLRRLNQEGYVAYLVGGGVRDLLLKKRPKDFDITTDATPEQVRKIFKNSRIIGRRFRIAHVYFQGEIIEVSTFRANIQDPDTDELDAAVSAVRHDNVYGTIEEDAWRRDFTVNALYYSIDDLSVIDYTGGMMDIKSRQICMIGDPTQRYHEDPVRMLRAIRLAAKCDFSIEPATEAPLYTLADLLQHVPPARLFDEVLKLFFSGFAEVSYHRLNDYHYLEVLFPLMIKGLKELNEPSQSAFINLALQATDYRFRKGQSLNPGFLLSVFLWPALQLCMKQHIDKGKKLYHALHLSIEEVFQEQNQHVSIPRRLTAMMRAIWMLQYHMQRRREDRVWQIASNRYFRAAQDFLELRAKAEDPQAGLSEWWRKFRHANPPGRRKLMRNLDRKK